MSYEFVHTNPDRNAFSGEDRRRIRSQAMRSYRRRQRSLQEQSGVSSREEGHENDASRPPSSSPGPSRSSSIPRSVRTYSSDVTHHRSRSRLREEVPRIRDLSGTSTRSQSSSMSSTSVEHSQRFSQRQSRESSLSQPIRDQRGTPSTFAVSSARPRRPGRIESEVVDPLRMPGQLEQMLSICESYHRWLLARCPEDMEPPVRASGPWASTGSEMALFALCLKSIGHLESLDARQHFGDKRLFKTRVLALLNECLKNPANALEDETIGALACLTSYEISRGSTEARLHLTGLSQIIRLRGGINSMGRRGGLYLFLEILDLVHAVFFHTRPLYTSANSFSQEAAPEYGEIYRDSSPDETSLEEISDFLMSIPEITETDRASSEDITPEDLAISDEDENGAGQWHQSFVRGAQDVTSSRQQGTTFACDLAASLHVGTTSPIKAHPRRVQEEAEALFGAMSELPDDAWDVDSELQLRILLTAMTASTSRAHKSWYNAHLTRCLYRMGTQDWIGVKNLLLRFLSIQASARQPSTRAVRVLANDVEIVVDRAEATESMLQIQTGLIDP